MTTVESKPPLAARSSRRRWIVRTIGLFVLLLVAFVLVLPYAMSLAAVRSCVFPLVFHNMHGQVTADTFRCGWFSAPEIDNFAIRTYDGQPVVAVERVTLEHSPWEMLCHPSLIGRIEVDHPSVELIVREGGSNFADVFRGPRQGLPARLRQESIQWSVRNAEFRWKLAKSDHDWGVGSMQLTGRLEPEWETNDHEARLVIDPITAVDHAELTRDMCDDLLKYLVPELARAKIHGAASLVIAGGMIPLDHLRDADIRGVLVLHDVDVGPSPMLEGITSKLGLRDDFALARDVEVHFTVALGRVHHEGLELGTGELRIRTSGDVGFDQSLDLLAEVRVELSESTIEKRPALAPLNNRSLKLPIKGTLEKPEIGWGTLGGGLASQLGDVLRGNGEPGKVQDLVQGLLGQATGQADGEGNAAAQISGAALDLLKQMRDRRRERLEQPPDGGAAGAPGSDSPDAAQPPASTAPRRPLLDRFRERREDREAEGAAPPASP